MRRLLPLLLATAAAAVPLSGTASAVTPPKVAVGGCDLVVESSASSCVVVINRGGYSEAGLVVWDEDATGTYTIQCTSGFTWQAAGGYGTYYQGWYHTQPDVCTFTVAAAAGIAEGYAG